MPIRDDGEHARTCPAHASCKRFILERVWTGFDHGVSHYAVWPQVADAVIHYHRHCQVNEKSPIDLFLVSKPDRLQGAKIQGDVKEENDG